ncbi:hypothetical protein B0H19DRAFT_1144876 [Mycena capillaripes]|nr:hypothetical protein B0H19DRAFT_1144876 [Mycena capillaripes]
MDIRGRLRRMETDYGRPAKEFFTQSFQEYPTATTVCVVTSFIPVVLAIALALFACVLAVSGVLVTVVGLGLSLVVILSFTLMFSAAVTLVVSCALRFGGKSAQTGEPAATGTASAATEPTEGPASDYGIPFRRAFTAFEGSRRTMFSCRAAHILFFPMKATNWRTRLVAAVLFRNLFARIFLPRWMRYHPFYPYVFGSSRAAHPLKWVLINAIQPIITVAEALFKLVRVAHGLVSAVGLESILAAGVLILVLSPRARSGRHAALAAIVSFLRTTLDSLEETVPAENPSPAPAAVPVRAEQPAADAVKDEIVPPVVGTPGQDATSTGVSTTAGTVPDMRARNVAGAA